LQIKFPIKTAKAVLILAAFATLLLAVPSAIVAQSTAPQYNAARKKLLAQNARVNAQGPFHADWNSLQNYKIPEWYQDAKFGIFIHWGVYSVPAFHTEWYAHDMYQKDSAVYTHQIAAHGPETTFGYKDYIPMFRAQHFDPQDWARLLHDAGARYVVPVAEHHDGFAMYDSGLSEWTAKKMGPHRDVIGELATAMRAQGIHFGLSTHREEHYWFYNGGFDYPSDVKSMKYTSLYGYPLPPGQVHHNDVSKDTTHPPTAFLDDWLARDTELIDKYHPEVVYFDWWINHPDYTPYLQRFAAFYYNYAAANGFPAVINYKQTAMPEGSAVFDVERGQLPGIRKLHWQTDTSVSNKSWGYIQNDTFKSPQFIVDELVDVVSKNGNLLLNIGPRSDGTIPAPVRQILLQVGGWLHTNGEAIYSTRPWTQFGEGPTQVAAGSFHDTEVQTYTPADFRFTTKGKTLYAIELARPSTGDAVIQALSSKTETHVGNVELIGSTAHLKWKQQPDGLHVTFPSNASKEYAYAYRITLQ
jgi:alpha-L-fucosidase